MARVTDAPRRARSSRWSYRLGRVAGIEIRVHATMFVLVWLVLLTAEESETVMGLLGWVVLIFAGVLLHELAHSLVARRAGVTVTEIELLPIGGVSKMERIPDRPADELAIALAGPLTSVAIGVAALAAAAATGRAPWPPDLYAGALVPRVGWFNLFVGAFNLLPALPLDGGRVLRAHLERRVGPFEATQQAARFGRWMAVGLILIGALVNLFLLLIGVFVYVTARGEEMANLVRHALDGVMVRDVMLHGAAVVSADESVRALRDRLPYTAQREFAVVDSAAQYVGIVDASDLRGDDGGRIGQLAEPRPVARPDDTVTASGILERGRSLAVLDGDRVVGLLRFDDVTLLVDRAVASRRSAPPASTR
jgi:Zn-dependent protease